MAIPVMAPFRLFFLSAHGKVLGRFCLVLKGPVLRVETSGARNKFAKHRRGRSRIVASVVAEQRTRPQSAPPTATSGPDAAALQVVKFGAGVAAVGQGVVMVIQLAPDVASVETRRRHRLR